MKRSRVDPSLISHLDACARELVWFVGKDGERSLYGIKRLAEEHRVNSSTVLSRWIRAGRPDEIPLSMLANPEDSYHGRSWIVDGVPFPSIAAVSGYVGKVEATISARFIELGRRSATSEELRSRKPRETEEERSAKNLQLLPDGSMHSALDLSAMFNVPISTIKRRRANGQDSFSREELRAMARKAPPAKRQKEQRRPSVPDWMDINPEHEGSLMERALSRV